MSGLSGGWQLLVTVMTIDDEQFVFIPLLPPSPPPHRLNPHHSPTSPPHPPLSLYLLSHLTLSPHSPLPTPRSVSTTIFGSFNCTSIDPEKLLPGTPTYLRNDYSISCDSPRYRFGVVWAVVMIFIYPIGIPLMYFGLLYSARNAIKVGKDKRRIAEMALGESDLNNADGAGAGVGAGDGEGGEEKGEQGRKGPGLGPLGGPLATLQGTQDTQGLQGPQGSERDTQGYVGVHRQQSCATGLQRQQSSAASMPPVRSNSSMFARRFSQLTPDIATAAAESTGIIKYIASEIGFLHNAYRGSCWYWEVVEAIRKLLLTAVVSIVGTGSASQIVYAIAVVVIFMVVAYVEPHFYREDDFLAVLTYYQILLILFIALLLRTDALPGEDWQRGMDGVMVVLIFVPPLFALGLMVDVPKWRRRLGCGKEGVGGG